MDTTMMPYDWTPFESSLAWLERIHTLLEACGGLRQADQLILGALTRGLLAAAVGESRVPLGAVTSEGSAVGDRLGAVTGEPERPADAMVPADTRHEAKPRTRTPRPKPVPTAAQNGHAEPEQVLRSLNDRLRELGYPEDLDRGTRIRLGQVVVERYKARHGKAPQIGDRGRGQHATRVSLYPAADLPWVDAVIQDILGAIIAEVPTAAEG